MTTTLLEASSLLCLAFLTASSSVRAGSTVDHSKRKERMYWLQHKQLANLLNLNLQEEATVGITLNLVFVGFSGSVPPMAATALGLILDNPHRRREPGLPVAGRRAEGMVRGALLCCAVEHKIDSAVWLAGMGRILQRVCPTPSSRV